MFHVDVTLEDTRIIGVEPPFPNNHSELNVTFADNLTGKQFVKRLPLATVGKILYVVLSGNDSGWLDGFSYASLESEFTDCPNECRPIP